MPEFLTTAFQNTLDVNPLYVFVRLLTALAMGVAIAWIFEHTDRGGDRGMSFPTTLILLCALVAMVTQVIGDNVARAFSLVGALSIVRFRTVVREPFAACPMSGWKEKLLYDRVACSQTNRLHH